MHNVQNDVWIKHELIVNFPTMNRTVRAHLDFIFPSNVRLQCENKTVRLRFAICLEAKQNLYNFHCISFAD